MGKVFMSGIAPTLVAPVSYKATFADNDWATIIKACQKNKVPETWTVGSQKTMTINGTDYAIDIIGKNHDTYSDGSGTAPLTFQMHDCYGTLKEMYGTTWSDSSMRLYYLPAILELMPSEVQAGIKTVNKITSAGYQTYKTSTTEDKLFLLSEIEIYGSTTYSNTDSGTAEGSQYAYYSAGNSKVKNRNNSAYTWWERSPSRTEAGTYCYVYDNGTALYGYNSNAFGVAFAFCF